ncbi:MAG: protein-glutamate O-methyltransferase CheR [bacterium]
MASQKQLEISSDEFRKISELIYKHAGIRLKDTKKSLVKSRLKKRVRDLGLSSFQEYYDRVTGDRTGQELSFLLQAISTNVTSFFREQKHFDFMESQVVPEMVEKYNTSSDRTYIHLWSSACSTGQEPYTMAISLLESLPDPDNFRTKILGTDISPEALRSAKKGIYRMKDVEDVDRMIQNRYFDTVEHEGQKKVRVKDKVREMVKFGRLNLNNGEFPFSKKFDVIFCRNVTIYFDKPVVQTLINRFERYLKDGGYLFMGHSESLAGIDHDLEFVQATIYRK